MSMTMIDKKQHAARRRGKVKAVTPEAIQGMEEKMLKNLRHFCGALTDSDASRDWSSPKDMTKLVGYLVSDIMGDVTFSRNWNVFENEENRHFVDKLPQGVAGIHLVCTHTPPVDFTS